MPERQCSGCKRQADWGCEAVRYPSNEENPDAQQDEDGSWWAWWKPAHLPLSVDGEETFACPRQDLRKRAYAWHRMLLFYGMYKKGHLPQPGAVMDQSNKAIELFRIFDDVNFECDQTLDEQERSKRNQEAQQPKGRRR